MTLKSQAIADKLKENVNSEKVSKGRESVKNRSLVSG